MVYYARKNICSHSILCQIKRAIMIKIDADISADWYIVYNTKTNVYMIICRDARYINVALRALCNRLGKNMGCNAKYN